MSTEVRIGTFQKMSEVDANWKNPNISLVIHRDTLRSAQSLQDLHEYIDCDVRYHREESCVPYNNKEDGSQITREVRIPLFVPIVGEVLGENENICLVIPRDTLRSAQSIQELHEYIDVELRYNLCGFGEPIPSEYTKERAVL